MKAAFLQLGSGLAAFGMRGRWSPEQRAGLRLSDEDVETPSNACASRIPSASTYPRGSVHSSPACRPFHLQMAAARASQRQMPVCLAMWMAGRCSPRRKCRRLAERRNRAWVPLQAMDAAAGPTRSSYPNATPVGRHVMPRALTACNPHRAAWNAARARALSSAIASDLKTLTRRLFSV